MSDAVPAIAPTVITMLASKPAPLWSRQDTVVAAIHDRHKHDCWSNIVVAEKSVLPKLRPLTVTDITADVAEFEIEYDTTGASRVNNAAAVPATAPTVSRTSSRSSGTFLDIAVTEVADDQRTVAQIRSASIVLRVYSMLPNERPVTVTDVPPLIAAL
jgi:hypothetical protein